MSEHVSVATVVFEHWQDNDYTLEDLEVELGVTTAFPNGVPKDIIETIDSDGLLVPYRKIVKEDWLRALRLAVMWIYEDMQKEDYFS